MGIFLNYLFTIQAKVTGTTLNGKKEKLQAPEGDKDKWNFLNFAEAWTPNEDLNEIKNEVLFTHVRMYICKSYSVSKSNTMFLIYKYFSFWFRSIIIIDFHTAFYFH